MIPRSRRAEVALSRYCMGDFTTTSDMTPLSHLSNAQRFNVQGVQGFPIDQDRPQSHGAALDCDAIGTQARDEDPTRGWLRLPDNKLSHAREPPAYPPRRR